jgi:dienelactone hydrolase
MTELPVVFGAERHLVGTLTLPDGATRAPVAFLLLNAGIVNRTGPHRINVKLARRLAAEGYASLRFDLSGQGDSRVSSSTGTFAEQNVADLRAAMDHVGRTIDLHRFAIAGICSGADNGWGAAQVDERVTGLFMIDGFAFPTAKTRWVRLRLRAQGPILSAILPVLRRRLAAFTARRAPDAAVDYGRWHPTREHYVRVMQALVDRGVRMCLLFSGSMLPQYNHESQFRDAFAGEDFATRVRTEYQPLIDHTVTPIDAQRRLVDLVIDWARGLGEPAPAAAPAVRRDSAAATSAP